MMRVTFDSNAWEPIFDPANTKYAIIQNAIITKRIEGFICEAAFRIEAVRRKHRAKYFAQPHVGSRFEGIVERDGLPYFKMSIGPEDNHHPGLPLEQTPKLQEALKCGVRLVRASAWMGLPTPQAPQEFLNPAIFVPETRESTNRRVQRQIEVSTHIEAGGVGKAAFDAAGGWNLPPTTLVNQTRFYKACAEWADGEALAAHVGYGNDVFCTEDFGKSGLKPSVLDGVHRAWLTRDFDVQFATLDQLAEKVAAPD
jgi:hypothetical protein